MKCKISGSLRPDAVLSWITLARTPETIPSRKKQQSFKKEVLELGAKGVGGRGGRWDVRADGVDGRLIQD
jgi:hypothetical protein